MLVLNLEVNLNFKRRREKVKKTKDRKVEDDEDDEKTLEPDDPIKYEPSITQVISVLQKPIVEWLLETVNSFYELEKDLVPLVDVDRRRAYEIDANNEWVQWGLTNIEKYVRQGF